MPGARLSVEEREEIALGIVAGDSLAAIGQQLGRGRPRRSREKWPATVAVAATGRPGRSGGPTTGPGAPSRTS